MSQALSDVVEGADFRGTARAPNVPVVARQVEQTQMVVGTGNCSASSSVPGSDIAPQRQAILAVVFDTTVGVMVGVSGSAAAKSPEE